MKRSAVSAGIAGTLFALLFDLRHGQVFGQHEHGAKEQQQEAFESGQLTVLLMGSDRREGEEGLRRA